MKDPLLHQPENYLEGLSDLRDGEENPNFRDVITGVIEAIEGGNSFSQALGFYPKIFDDVFVNLIKVGERSGKMSDVLVDITSTLKWQDDGVRHIIKGITSIKEVGRVADLTERMT